MRLILVTLILASISVYVFINYDDVKCWITGENPNQDSIEQSIEEPDNHVKTLKNNEPKEPQTKFQPGDVVYIDSSVGDTMKWQQNEVPLWKTYDGSDEEEYQNTSISLPHRIKVKVVKAAQGADDITWYYIRTAKGLPTSGWVQEQYLSKELPKRRRGRTGDWGL
jgi:hypothetical protein